MAKAKTSAKGGKSAGKKGAAKKPATTKKAAETKGKAKAAPKASKADKAPKSKKAAPAEFGRVAGSAEAVEQALKNNDWGRWLMVTANYPEKTIRVLDEPSEWRLYDRHWPRGAGMRHACRSEFGEKDCATCQAGDQPREATYFRVVLIDPETGAASRIMLYEPPVTVVKALIKNGNRRGTLLDRDYTIERTGSGQKDTTYTVMGEDKKSRTAEIKKLEKDDPVDILAEFERLWNEHLAMLNKAEDDDEEETTSNGAASPLEDDDDDDDLDADLEDDDDDDEDDDEAESDDDDDNEEEEDDESDDDDDDDEDDDESDESDDDDEEDESDDDDDDDEEEEDEDDDDGEGDESEQSGVFLVNGFDTTEATLDLTHTDSGTNYPSCYYDEDEFDLKALKVKKGAYVNVEMAVDDEDDWVIDSMKAAKKPAAGKTAAKGKGGKKK